MLGLEHCSVPGEQLDHRCEPALPCTSALVPATPKRYWILVSAIPQFGLFAGPAGDSQLSAQTKSSRRIASTSSGSFESTGPRSSGLTLLLTAVSPGRS